MGIHNSGVESVDDMAKASKKKKKRLHVLLNDDCCPLSSVGGGLSKYLVSSKPLGSIYGSPHRVT